MNRAAQQLGRLGGKVKSAAKTAAAKRNWQIAVAAIKKKKLTRKILLANKASR